LVRAGVIAEGFEDGFQIANRHALAEQVLHDLLQFAGLDLRGDDFFDQGRHARLEIVDQVLDSWRVSNSWACDLMSSVRCVASTAVASTTV
jgi:hypothetical protein